MKVLITLILLASFAYCQGQKTFDNAIIVKGVSFNQVVTALLDQGYKIEKVDKDFQTVQTELTGRYNIAIYARVKDSTATITGKFFSSRIWEVYYEKSGGFGKRFMIIDAFAHSLNGKITYAKL